ncbi:MAG: TolC family protein [Candidatus Binatia bacterium]
MIELGGKRPARIDAAARARDLASRDYEVKRTEILAEVTRRFIRLLARQHGLALAKANVELRTATLGEVRRRVGAGADSPLEEKKAGTALARARIAAEHVEHQVRVARHELAAMWGSGAPRFERLEGDLFGRRAVPFYDELLARLAASPDIVRSLSEKQLREAEIRLADAKRVPNMSLGGGVRRLEGSGDNALVLGLSMPLPLSDRNQGGSQEARALLGKAEGAARATEARLRSLLFGLHQELLHDATALDAFEREILPGAEESLALSRSGFAGGRFSYLELADAERTLGEVKSERIETAASYHQFVLEIERLLGGPIEEKPGSGETPPAKEKALEQ